MFLLRVARARVCVDGCGGS